MESFKKEFFEKVARYKEIAEEHYPQEVQKKVMEVLQKIPLFLEVASKGETLGTIGITINSGNFTKLGKVLAKVPPLEILQDPDLLLRYLKVEIKDYEVLDWDKED